MPPEGRLLVVVVRARHLGPYILHQLQPRRNKWHLCGRGGWSLLLLEPACWNWRCWNALLAGRPGFGGARVLHIAPPPGSASGDAAPSFAQSRAGGLEARDVNKAPRGTGKGGSPSRERGPF